MHGLSLAMATENVTLTFTIAVASGACAIKIMQGYSVRSIIWPLGVKWPSGSTYVVSMAPNAEDLVTLFFDGSKYYGAAGKNYQ